MNIIVVVRKIPPTTTLMSLIINDLCTMSKGGRGGSVFGREKNFNGLDPLKKFKQKASQLAPITQFSTVFKRFSLLSWCMHWLKNEGVGSPSVLGAPTGFGRTHSAHHVKGEVRRFGQSCRRISAPFEAFEG